MRATVGGMTEPVRAVPWPPQPADALAFEPSGRWVRGTVGGTTVVDSGRPVLVWEPGRAVPLYAFPREDVRANLLTPSGEAPAAPHAGAAGWFDLTIEGVVLPAVAWTFGPPELAGLVAFEWRERTGRGVERWFEEDEEIFVHPRDPHRRVDALPSTRHVVVRVGGVVVADTHRPVLLFETGLPVRYYVRREDVDFTHLTPTDLHTRCPYKGIASYWSFRNGGTNAPNLVWSYPAPLPAVAAIRNLLAFYPEAADISVD